MDKVLKIISYDELHEFIERLKESVSDGKGESMFEQGFNQALQQIQEFILYNHMEIKIQ